MSGNSTPETERSQILYQQRVQDEINKVTSQQIQELTLYIKTLEERLKAKLDVPAPVSNKASFSLLAKPTSWNGDPNNWVDFEVDINSYLELSDNKTDLFRITWTLGYLSGDAKKFGKNFKATNPNCSFYEFIEAIKANFNVNSAAELALQKLQNLKLQHGANILQHLAKFNELRLNARIQNPNLAMNFLLDSLQLVYGQEIAKVAVFQPAIKTEYDVLNKWLLSIYDSDCKSKVSLESNVANVAPMDLSRITEVSVSQITRKSSPVFGWKRMPLEDHVLFQAFAKKFKLCTRCRDLGYGPSHHCRAKDDPFVRIPAENYSQFCAMMETCGLCLKCRDLALECSCNTKAKSYLRFTRFQSDSSDISTYYVRSLNADPSSKYLQLELNGTIFNILVDSGSQTSLLINAKLISRLNLDPVSITPIILRAFNGEFVEKITSSTKNLSFTLRDDFGQVCDYSESFLISHNMSVDVILGLPFCKKYNFFWDFGKDLICFFLKGTTCSLNQELIPQNQTYHLRKISASNGPERNVEQIKSVTGACDGFPISDIPNQELITQTQTYHLRNACDEFSISDIPGIGQLGDLKELEAVFDITRVNQLPALSDWALKINLIPEAKLKTHRPYKHSLEEEASLHQEIQNGLHSGRILRSTATVSSPVLFVKVPGKAPRMCVDYRELNSQTISEPAILPNIQDLLDKLPSNFKYLSKLDLKGAFHQLRMHPESEDLTTFVCGMGTFKYRVMPFGLKNAPGHFQRFMDSILLYKITDDGHYIDDIIFVDVDRDVHISKIRNTLKILLENGLLVSPQKCNFFADKIEFLGHQLEIGGKISPLESRIAPILNYPVPKNVKQIQAFLGFCNYYRRFLKDFSNHATHLSNLTRKDIPFEWTSKENDAFNFLKNSFKDCLLFTPDRTVQFVLETDASDYALGAALHQNGRPIAFYSRKFTSSEINYPIYDKELLAILASLQHWRHLLIATEKPILICSDHKNLVYFKKPQHLNRRQARWQQELTQYHFQITYKKGVENVAADVLSRDPSLSTNSGDIERSINDQTLLPNSVFVNSVELDPYEEGYLYHADDSPVCDVVLPVDSATGSEYVINAVESYNQPANDGIEDAEIANDNLADTSDVISLTDLRPVYHAEMEESLVLSNPTKTTFRNWPIHVQMLLAGIPLPDLLSSSFKAAIKKQKSKFLLKNGVLLRKVMVNNQELAVPYVPVHLRTELMLTLHQALGHLKNPSILDALKLQGWWPSMENDFKHIHNECEICKLFEVRGKNTVHPMHPLPVPFLPFHTWHIDWIQDLPESVSGKRNILVAIDSATRMMLARAYSNRDVPSQLDFMNILMVERGYGAPKILISDRAKSFVESSEWKKFCQIHGIETRFSTSYHPQTNGRVERLNSLIGKMLSKFCAGDTSRWDSFLEAICFNLNIRKHSVTGYAPFYLAYGFTPRLPGNLTPPSVYDFQQEIDRDAYQARELELLGHARAAAFFRSQAQARRMGNTHAANHKIKANEFKIGDKVKLSRQRLPGMFTGKLAPKWDGPYEIGSIGPHDSYYIHKDGIYQHHPVNSNHLMLWKESPEEEDTVVNAVT